MGFSLKKFFSDPIGSITDTATMLTGNPIGMPGADVNMIQRPTDVGHFSPVTKGAGLIGGSMLLAGGSGAAAGGTGTAGGAAGTVGNAGSASTMRTLANVATILSPIVSAGMAVAGVNAAKDAQKLSLQTPGVTPMPTSGGPNTIFATRNAVGEQLRRRGRASTIMTSPEAETLG